MGICWRRNILSRQLYGVYILHVSDRHFVMFALSPVIRKFYNSNNNLGWKFIKDKCISSEKKVKKFRPDFLNRSVCEIVLERYAESDKKISGEAFEILKEFILSKRGIPHKSDLIFQVIVGSDLSDDKKWGLINLTIKEYGIPVNPFVEQIVVNLAKKGNKAALSTLKKWFKDKKYYKHIRFDRDSVSTIYKLLDENSDFAIELFKDFITSDYIKNGTGDRFSAYSVATLLNAIIKKDYDKGLSIIRILEKEDKLSDDQQIIYSFSLISQGNDDSDDPELLSDIFRDVVDPFLNKYNNNVEEIYKRLPVDTCREALVQFAVRLATHKKISDAVRIIRVFIKDPDPYLPGENPNDKEDKYNEHKQILEGKDPHTITSVRGWCGWALMKCSISYGRKQIQEIIDLTKILIEDKNYYVVNMACSALSQLATNRLTVLLDNPDVFFFNDDKKKALKLSKEVENMAFSLLDRLMTWSEPAQKAMTKIVLHAFDPIRSLNEVDSLRLVTNWQNCQ